MKGLISQNFFNHCDNLASLSVLRGIIPIDLLINLFRQPFFLNF